MLSLGLDPSLTGFGWAVHQSTATGRKRVVARGVVKTSPRAVFIWRYMYMRQAVCEILDTYPDIAGVGVESPPFGAEWSEGLYGLFLYVNEALFTYRKNAVYFDPLRVKMLARMDSKVRRGTMDKRDMIEAAKADTTIKSWNHNEADAYIIARSAARFWEYLNGSLKEDDLTPSEHQVFLATHKYTRGKQAGRVKKQGIVFKEGDRFFRFSDLDTAETTLPSTIIS